MFKGKFRRPEARIRRHLVFVEIGEEDRHENLVFVRPAFRDVELGETETLFALAGFSVGRRFEAIDQRQTMRRRERVGENHDMIGQRLIGQSGPLRTTGRSVRKPMQAFGSPIPCHFLVNAR